MWNILAWGITMYLQHGTPNARSSFSILVGLIYSTYLWWDQTISGSLFDESAGNSKKRPHPWDTHYQFSIKTLLSLEN